MPALKCAWISGYAFAFIGLVLQDGAAIAAGPDIPATFESAPVLSPELDDFVPKCMPTATGSEMRDTAQKTPQNGVAVRSSPDATKPYLVVSNGQVFCVRSSPQRFPILGLSAFDATMSFTGMDAETSKRLYTDLAQQIALRGFGTARLINDEGNAIDIVYLLTANAPTKIYYRGGFIKKEDFASVPLAAGSNTYTISGAWSITGHGQPPEYVKSLFSK